MYMQTSIILEIDINDVQEYMRTRSCEYCHEVKDIPVFFAFLCFVMIFFSKKEILPREIIFQ